MKKKSHKISDTKVYDAYKVALLLRQFEEKCAQLYLNGSIAGFCHLYTGQEAVIVGTKEAMNDGDALVTSYRCHAHNLIVGTDPKYVFAELLGKETGVSKGKGGSMHLFDVEKRFFGGHGIVGAQVPISTGIAFADKYKGNNSVTIAFMGDGAANQGQVFESFNMAKLWNLPIVYVIEDNKYSMGTSCSRHTAVADFETRGASFNIPGVKMDGMDFFDVYEKMSQAITHARDGNGPYIVSADTYRYRGHSMSDPAKYRSKDEVNEYKNTRDPIECIKTYLMSNKITNEKKIDEIESNTKLKIEESLKFAIDSHEPHLDTLYNDVLV